MVSSAQFSPDGSSVVTGSLDNTARIWDSVTGRLLTERLKHDRSLQMRGSAQFDRKRSILNVTPDKDQDAFLATFWTKFSPGGKFIVTASGDHTARIWDASTGEPRTNRMQHDGAIQSAEFSPDGKRLVTASWDSTARVWDAETGQPLTAPLKHDSAVNTAVFSPDGGQVSKATNGFEYRFWLYGFIRVSADVVLKSGSIVRLRPTNLEWEYTKDECAKNGKAELSW